MRRLVPLLLLGLAAWPSVADRAPEEEPPPLVTAEALWDDPGAHLGGEVRFAVQHANWIDAWNPLATRFGAGDYRAWSAWSDAQLLWRPEDYSAPAVRLFVRRGGAAEWALEGLERYRRFEIVGKVTAVLGDVPWIEVVGVRPLTRHMNDGSLVHAERALGAYGRREWKRAIAELDRALAAPVPPPAKAELLRLRALCRERIENPTLQDLVERDLERKG